MSMASLSKSNLSGKVDLCIVELSYGEHCKVKKKEANSVINYSPSCSFKPVRHPFIFGTQIKIFLMESESSQTLHRQQGSLHIFSKMVLGWRQIWIKSLFFFSFAHKKYSRSFVKLLLNPWCHMDYFTDLLATFLDLDRVRTLAVYGGSESSQIPSKNILICVPKMNGGLTGLERYEGE